MLKKFQNIINTLLPNALFLYLYNKKQNNNKTNLYKDGMKVKPIVPVTHIVYFVTTKTNKKCNPSITKGLRYGVYAIV